jgi:hypothetical protein
VQIADFIGVNRPVFEFLDGADDRNFTVVSHPDRQGRTPETVAADAPVAGVLQPFAKPAGLDVPRRPVDLHVIANQSVFEIADPHQPVIGGVIQQRRVTAPAERISMLEGFGRVNQVFMGQMRDDWLVGTFEELAGDFLGQTLVGNDVAVLIDGNPYG